jgi:hypothetical protein
MILIELVLSSGSVLACRFGVASFVQTAHFALIARRLFAVFGGLVLGGFSICRCFVDFVIDTALVLLRMYLNENMSKCEYLQIVLFLHAQCLGNFILDSLKVLSN